MRERSTGDRRGAALVRWLALALCLLLLHVASIGPMTRLLSHRDETAYRTWQVVYGEPLGKLPLPLRNLVNRYIRLCDGIDEPRGGRSGARYFLPDRGEAVLGILPVLRRPFLQSIFE